MPLRSPADLKFLLSKETELFTTTFLETAQPPHLSQRAYEAAEQFTAHVSTEVARFCDTISEQTQFAQIHTFLQNLFNPPEVNIFTPETFPVWQNYIEALMQQIFSQMPEEDTHKETMGELFGFLSTIFPKTCWVDLCVTHLEDHHPTVLPADYSVKKTRDCLVLQHAYSSGPRLTIPPTNFCCFLFNRIFSTFFTKNELLWNREARYIWAKKYRDISDAFTHHLLISTTNPLHDPRLKKALIYLSHTSSDPFTLQSFLDSHSLFLFSPSFFYALFLNIPWAIRFLETALSIRDEGEPLKLTHETLAEWLAQSDVHATDLIEWLQELLREGKLEFQLDRQNLPENTFASLLNILFVNKNPIAVLNSTLSILHDYPDFLEAFEGDLDGSPSVPLNMSTSSSVCNIFFTFIVSLQTQGYLNTALWVQIKKLPDIIRADDTHDSLITYLEMLTKYQWRDSDTINCLLSVVINVPVTHNLQLHALEGLNLSERVNTIARLNITKRLNIIERLNTILQSNLFSHPEDVIELVSPGNPRNFPKNFQTDFMLDKLIEVIKVLKIQLSPETIRSIAGNPEKRNALDWIYFQLRKRGADRSIQILTHGIQHLHEIGIPFEEILTVFIYPHFRDTRGVDIDDETKWELEYLVTVMELNDPEQPTYPNQREIFQKIIQDLLNAPEAFAETSMHRTALLLSFALASKEKEPEMSPADHIIHTLRTYFSSFQKVLNEMSQDMSDEEKEPLKKRLYALFARVIQQEKAPPLLMQEVNMVASTIEFLAEAFQPPDDGREPLPSLVLRTAVYEHSLLLFTRATKPAPGTSSLETNTSYVHSFLGL